MSQVHLRIKPEPLPEEAAAILAVLRRPQAQVAPDEALAPRPAIWLLAGRREAQGGGRPWEPIGWSVAARLRGGA